MPASKFESTGDKETDAFIRRTLRYIDRKKIRKPEPGQTVGPCHWSKTGFAIKDSDGSCTCNPARAPRETVSSPSRSE